MAKPCGVQVHALPLSRKPVWWQLRPITVIIRKASSLARFPSLSPSPPRPPPSLPPSRSLPLPSSLCSLPPLGLVDPDPMATTTPTHPLLLPPSPSRRMTALHPPDRIAATALLLASTDTLTIMRPKPSQPTMTRMASTRRQHHCQRKKQDQGAAAPSWRARPVQAARARRPAVARLRRRHQGPAEDGAQAPPGQARRWAAEQR